MCDVKTLLSVFLFSYFSSACADINTAEEAKAYCKSQSVLFATRRGMYDTTFYISFSVTGNVIGGEYIFQNLFGSLISGMP